MKNIFLPEVSNEIIERINHIKPDSQPLWGKMNAAQMMAHCCVTYEMAYENKHKAPNVFMKFILKTFIKDSVVGPKPYKKNSQTAPAFLIKDERDFNTEKKRLIAYIKETQESGAKFFDGKESLSFGKLSEAEWNVMFYKHLDHHLGQFGV
ncbi:DUF1569 domain-containing protein [Dyadobacter sp. NIV53]|uniref:DUF1569 domain-containing protein n=1 Tax=Dyadobacter sp. NIV53 TaxID=2861765 RepID=UPI001C88AB4F|nr:DUF1569 domain-containing protein [Dyadobacter sp. NIV53]